tara:strand:+ start:100 stop:432 length:333 start_codon:yes stop_codon:yes gene_type:complete
MKKVVARLKASMQSIWKLGIDDGEAKLYHTQDYIEDQRKQYDIAMDEIEIAITGINEFEKRVRAFRGLLGRIETTTGSLDLANIIDEFDEFVNLDSYEMPESPARKRGIE